MPEPYRIVMSKRAANNLQGIFDFIAQDSPANASRMISRILADINDLKILPHRTVVQDQPASRRPPVRSLPVRPYVVFFRVFNEDRVVRILHVRHGARRSPKRF